MAAALMADSGCADGRWRMADGGDEGRFEVRMNNSEFAPRTPHQASAIRHLPSAICHPPSAIREAAIRAAAIREAAISAAANARSARPFMFRSSALLQNPRRKRRKTT